MHFKVNNRYTEVISDWEEGLRIIRGWCTKEYTYYGQDWSQKPPRRVKKVDNITYFKNNLFPTGWAGRFIEDFKSLGDEVVGGRGLYKNITWEDCRKKPPFKPPLKGNVFPLRDYQQEALDASIISARGIIHHATGAGKTVVMAKLLETLALPSIVIVPTINLLLQTSEDLIGFLGEEVIGVIGNGVFNPKLITVATVQSLWSKIKADDHELKKVFHEAHVLIVDEAHHITIAGRNKIKNTYFQIAQLLDTYYKFGLTATPGEEGELERELLEAATGRVIHRVDSSYLIKRGLLTRPVIQLYKVTPSMRISDWQAAYRQNILRNAKRNSIVVSLANKYSDQGKSVLIIVNRVAEHGGVLQELLPHAFFMSGDTNIDDRKMMLNDFKDKKTLILISTVINEGVNIPSMDVIIMAGGGKSNKQTIQRVGRALRKSKGKEIARIIDFYDADNGMLERHSKARLKTYKQEAEFEILPMVEEKV